MMVEQQRRRSLPSPIDEGACKMRRYKANNDLAHFCQQLMSHTATPNCDQLNQLVHDYCVQHGDPGNPRQVRSKVKEWFRKRREYMASKIYRACDELMSGFWEDMVRLKHDQLTSQAYQEIVGHIVADDVIVDHVAHAASLPIFDLDGLRAFVRKKIRDYFDKLCVEIVPPSHE